ncbi:hypothetical protein P4571_06635 [Niallia alba]|uniref:hypothetical protein n=1 Tax=Niallia alba TaxID=2729105 RepID=UPI002E2314FB|nr:hypothetical protein [Niallia alba]
MKLENHLRTDTKEKLNKIKNSKNKLNERDVHELMGSNKRGMKRGKGGAYRNA